MDRARLYRLSIAVTGGLLTSVALLLIARHGRSTIAVVLLGSGVGQTLGVAAESLWTDGADPEPGPVAFWTAMAFTGIGLVGAVLFVLS